MRIAKLDIVLCAIMLASLAGTYAMSKDHVLDDWLCLPQLAPLLFFAFPLCQTFLTGISSAHDQMRGTVAGSPWTTFGNVMWPRLCLWLALWIVYFVVFEVWLAVITGWHWVVSVSSIGLLLGMVAVCFAWGPRCKKLWILALLTIFTAVSAFILLFFLSAFVLTVLGLDGFYGIGIVLYPPWIIFACLLLAAIVSWFWAWRRGDAWFRA